MLNKRFRKFIKGGIYSFVAIACTGIITLFPATTNAEILPVSDMNISYDGDYGWALRSNGDLLFWDQGTSFLPVKIASDVVAVEARGVITTYNTGQFLRSNGEVVRMPSLYFEEQEPIVIATDGKKLVEGNATYINKNDQLIFSDSVIMDNVSTAGKSYAVKTNGELWSWNTDTSKNSFLMSDIIEIYEIPSCKSLLVRDKDSSLWHIDVGETVMCSKILSNVVELVVINNQFVHGRSLVEIYALSDDNKLYKGTADSKGAMVSLHTDNVVDISTINDHSSDGYPKCIYLNSSSELMKMYFSKNSVEALAATVDDDVLIDINVSRIVSDNLYIAADDTLKYIYNIENLTYGDKIVVRQIPNSVGVNKILWQNPGKSFVIFEKENKEVYGYGQLEYIGAGKSASTDDITGEAILLPICIKDTKVVFDGSPIKITQRIQTRDGRTFYPFRECLEAIGARVLWDNETQTAIGETSGHKVEFQIGNSEYKVNGEIKTMDTSAYIDEDTGRTYIPLRFAAEGLGFTVDWQPGTSEDVITIK